jgi:hypothetical protein
MKLQILDDIRWAWGMLRLRRLRRHLSFNDRLAVDEALRHRLVIAYPDAFWRAQRRDVRAAIVVAEAAAWANPEMS